MNQVDIVGVDTGEIKLSDVVFVGFPALEDKGRTQKEDILVFDVHTPYGKYQISGERDYVFAKYDMLITRWRS